MQLKYSVLQYLQRYNTSVKADDETYAAYSSKLRGLLVHYLNSRSVTTFDELKELYVCHSVKSSSSENCIKYEYILYNIDQILMTCLIREISAVYNQRSGKAQISDVNKSKILINFFIDQIF